MQLSIIEIDYHPEVLRNLCHMLRLSKHKVTLYTTQRIWKKVRLDDKDLATGFKIQIKPKGKSMRYFFKNHQEEINRSDLIYFNTLASHFRLFSQIKFTPPTAVLIHNAHADFKPLKTYRPILEPFFIWKDFSHFIRKTIIQRDSYYRKKWLDTVDYYLFPTHSIAQYTAKQQLAPAKKIVHEPVPLAYYTHRTSFRKTNDATVKITVVGAVDQRRRDYKQLYDAFHNILPTLQNPIKLTLLGPLKGLYGKKINTEFSRLSSANFNFKSYTSYVPQNEFESVIDQTDFLILPLKATTRYRIYTEIYGKTKMSGNEMDIIRYGLPALIPTNYPLSNALQQITDTFTNGGDLATKIEDWVSGAQYKKVFAPEALQDYTIENSAQKLSDIFSQLVCNRSDAR